jgi:outer membrane protein assembly factor BamB
MIRSLSAWVVAVAVGCLVPLGCDEAKLGTPPAATSANAPADEAVILAKAPSNEAGDDVSSSSEEVTSSTDGSDWPIFLGPHGTGVSDESGLLDEWPAAGPVVLWEQRIGKGYSSPSIRGDKLVVHHRQRNNDLIECVRADDGSPIWKHEYDTDFSDPYGYSNGPRCSPLLTKNRCYTFGAQGRLVCLDLKSGEVVWQRDTAKEWTVPNHFFGAGCTPILEGGLLIVLVGGQPNSGVVALDPETGQTKWESVGKATWDGAKTDGPGNAAYKWTGDEMLVSYSSPIAATIHGQRHLLCLVRQGLVALEPKTGRVRFKYWFRSRINDSVNAARPVVVGDQVLLSAAYETGAALLKVHRDGEGFDEVWRNRRGMSTHWSTPIHRDGCAFGFSGRHENEAMLQCIDVQTGDLVWETNGYEGKVDDLLQDQFTGQIKDSKTGAVIPWPYYGRGSKTYADGKYFVLGERGTLALTKLSRQGWKEISRTSFEKLKYPMWASPVLAHGRLYLRSEDWLMCLDVAKAGVRK